MLTLAFIFALLGLISSAVLVPVAIGLARQLREVKQEVAALKPAALDALDVAIEQRIGALEEGRPLPSAAVHGLVYNPGDRPYANFIQVPPRTLVRDRDGDVWHVRSDQCTRLVFVGGRFDEGYWSPSSSRERSRFAPLTVIARGVPDDLAEYEIETFCQRAPGVRQR